MCRNERDRRRKLEAAVRAAAQEEQKDRDEAAAELAQKALLREKARAAKRARERAMGASLDTARAVFETDAEVVLERCNDPTAKTPWPGDKLRSGVTLKNVAYGTYRGQEYPNWHEVALPLLEASDLFTTPIPDGRETAYTRARTYLIELIKHCRTMQSDPARACRPSPGHRVSAL